MTGREVLRWALALAATPLLFGGLILLGILLTRAMASVCPEEEVISGLCIHRWYDLGLEGIGYLCSAVMGFGTVLLTASAAPSRKWEVARVAFVLGAAYSVYVWISGIPIMWIVMAGVGGITGLIVSKRRWAAAYGSGRGRS